MKKNRLSRSTRINRIVVAAALIGVSAQFHVPLYAAPLTDEEAQALLQRVNELEQQVKVLQRNREVDQETAADKAKASPTVSLGANGLTVRSADTNFTMIAHGYIQADDRTYFGSKSTPDTFLLRRVRPIVEGTVWQDINYRLMLDFGSGTGGGSTANNVALLDDAYVNAKFINQAQIQIGKYKSPIGLERLQSSADLLFVETGYATQLTPNYDLGVSVHNDYFNQPVGYSVGLYTGAPDNASQDRDSDEGKDFVGRLFLQPFLNTDHAAVKNLGFGVAGSIGSHTISTLTSYTTPGQQTFFAYSTNVSSSGIQYRLDPQAYYYVGPFGLEGEYILSSQELKYTGPGSGTTVPTRFRANNTAWQVEASYFLTGEENSFKSTSLKHVIPNRRFSLGENSGWGAFEIVARIQRLALDNRAFAYGPTAPLAAANSAQEATSWGVGLNWYLNANLKLNFDYENTTFTRGLVPTISSSGTIPGDLKPENVILSRVQYSF